MSGPGVDLAFVSRRVVTPEGERAGAVLVKGEAIVGVVEAGQVPPGARVEDVGDAVILPGLVDTHVHINEPGRTDWEGFATATRAAAAGGVTTLVDMPLNSIPVTTTRDALAAQARRGGGAGSRRLRVLGRRRAGQPGGARPAARRRRAAASRPSSCHSGIDEFPAVERGRAAPGAADPRRARQAAARARRAGDGRCRSRRATRAATRPTSRRARRPGRREAVALLLRLCREHRAPRAHRPPLGGRRGRRSSPRRGARACRSPPRPARTTSPSPPRRSPTARTQFKCAPPIRERANRDALWAALARRHDRARRLGPLAVPAGAEAARAAATSWPPGAGSPRCSSRCRWSGREARRSGRRPRAARALDGRSARRGSPGSAARKGAIAPGCDADLVVFDPDAAFDGRRRPRSEHRHKLTPYLGRRLHGVVRQTWLRGRRVFSAGGFEGSPRGAPASASPDGRR